MLRRRFAGGRRPAGFCRITQNKTHESPSVRSARCGSCHVAYAARIYDDDIILIYLADRQRQSKWLAAKERRKRRISFCARVRCVCVAHCCVVLAADLSGTQNGRHDDTWHAMEASGGVISKRISERYANKNSRQPQTGRHQSARAARCVWLARSSCMSR